MWGNTKAGRSPESHPFLAPDFGKPFPALDAPLPLPSIPNPLTLSYALRVYEHHIAFPSSFAPLLKGAPRPTRSHAAPRYVAVALIYGGLHTLCPP